MTEFEKKLKDESVNYGDGVFLCENGIVIQKRKNLWYIRIYDKNEEMDSKWDICLKTKLIGSAACICFKTIEKDGFKTLEEAINVAEILKKSEV